MITTLDAHNHKKGKGKGKSGVLGVLVVLFLFFLHQLVYFFAFLIPLFLPFCALYLKSHRLSQMLHFFFTYPRISNRLRETASMKEYCSTKICQTMYVWLWIMLLWVFLLLWTS